MSHINRHSDYDDYWDDIEKKHKLYEEIYDKEFDDTPLGGFGIGLDILRERVEKILTEKQKNSD